MPDLPESAVQAAAEVRRRQYDSEFDASHLRWQDFSGEAREILDAAAPVLAGEIARKILAHMEAHGPAPEAPGVTRHEVLRRAWRRHFRIAAQVASGAFYTREDQLRLAAQAIERGDFIACNPPEVPGAAV